MPVTVMTPSQIQQFYNTYKKYLLPNTNEYIKYFFKIDGVTVSIYESGKVVFMGKDLSMFNKYFPISKYDNANTIGSDEVGTGDIFGPIVVASTYVKKEMVSELKELGVKDSKTIPDHKIVQIAQYVIKKYPDIYTYYILDNERLNDFKDKFNLNEFKAYIHNHNIRILKDKFEYDYICLDDFCGEKKYYNYLSKYDKSNPVTGISFETKGEGKSIAVALSSIIARYLFLESIKKLEEKYGYKLKLGGSKEVNKVIDKIKSDGNSKILYHIAKLSFKTFN